MYACSRRSTEASLSSPVSTEYILPTGAVTPNALFVGGLYMKVNENEMRDIFARFGSIKEVKIMTYRGGVGKGYGFVYFNGDVDIQSIVKQKISFKGRTFKLGPAILKDRSADRPKSSHLVGPARWMSPTQCFYYSWWSPMEGGMAQLSPVLSRGSPYNQPSSYSSSEGIMFPQMPMNYTQTSHAYEYTPPYWTVDQDTQPVNQSYLDFPYDDDASAVHSF